MGVTNQHQAFTEEVALKYKQLWMVEQIFRTVKSILTTRPIFHKCDETIRGHVFCSFLALVLLKLQQRLETKGLTLEWQDVIRDVNRLEEIDLERKTLSLTERVRRVLWKGLPGRERRPSADHPAV